MSAADKLRALDAELPIYEKPIGAVGPTETGAEANYTMRRMHEADLAGVLRSALPALIAVVEAAEELASSVRGDLGCVIEHHPERVLEAITDLDHALGSDRPKPGYDKPMFGGKAKP